MIAAGVAVLLIAGFLVWSVVGKKSTAPQYVTQPVTRGTLTVAVAGNGNVVSQSSASVNPAISGTVTELSVSLGSKVKKGDVLFVLENPDLDTSVVQAKGSYQNAQASTLKAKQAETQADVSLSTGVWQAKQTLQQAQAQVYNAQVAYYKLTDPSYPGYTPGASSQQIDAAESSLDAANTALKTAQKNYDFACHLQKEGHAAAEKTYQAAQTSQKSAYMSYQSAIANAKKRTVTAPISGYITTLSINNGDQLGSSSSSTKSSASGATTTNSSISGSTPIVISDLSELQAQVQIAETDRPKVKIGQKVELTFDAVPNLTITGKVAEIDAVGTTSSGVVSYGVTITFDVQNPSLSPGMTASASIVTQVNTDVLLVPNAAVKADTNGSSYVQVLAAPGQTPEDVTVEVGPAGDTQTEIKSGVTEGQQVVTQTITTGSSSSSSSRSGMSVLGGGGGRTGGGGGFRPGP
jgi:multidrug efflux pump subunit AcrA (membrane-fusion protein)